MAKDNSLEKLLARDYQLRGQLSLIESIILAKCQPMCDVSLIDCTWQPSDGFVLCFESKDGFPIDASVESVVSRYQELGRKLTHDELSRSF